MKKKRKCNLPCRSETVQRPAMTKKVADELIKRVYDLIRENPDCNEESFEVIFRSALYNADRFWPWRLDVIPAYDIKITFEYDKDDQSIWMMQSSVDNEIEGVGVHLYNAPVEVRKRAAFYMDELREHLLKGNE